MSRRKRSRRTRRLPSSPLPAPLRIGGAPLACLWGAGLVLRNVFAGTPERASVPVICVGNLTAGGTGKTPAAIWVSEVLKHSGRKPAILTRGYGQDETTLLSRAFPVVADPDRVAGAGKAVARGADVLVMDDGFQHRRLFRDLDIVLVDATDPWGGGHLLPWGRLREPKEALGRAGAVVITRVDQMAPAVLESLLAEVARLAPKALVAEAVHEAAGEAVPWLRGRTVVAACGIGNPQAFEKTLLDLGARVERLMAFPDHHPWPQADVERANAAAAGMDVVVTEKDWVKLEGRAGTGGWRALGVRWKVTRGEAELVKRVREAAGIGGSTPT